MSRFISVLLLVLFVGVLTIPAADLLFAQESGSQVAARRVQLEKELASLEEEIEQQQVLLQAKQRERVSLERDVAIFDAKIETARLAVRARTIAIQRLNQDIAGKEVTIGDLDEKFWRQQDSLAQLIRRTNEIDDYSLVEVLLGNQNLSEFFEDLDSFNSIKEALRDSFRVIEVTKINTEVQKTSLEGKRADELELRQIQELQKKKIEKQEAEKQLILTATKGVEERYQDFIRSKEKTAAQIRAELFTLRGTAAIPFEKALAYAVLASQKTGVRPALILGVIAQESRLGEFIGTGNWRTDMKNPRDTVPFLEITKRLGLDPDQMPVSKKPWYGWGGAMGPAQFIPSTWILYESRIAKVSGQNPPNPWDPRTAFIASALLLMDNGADRGTTSAERLAALRYFAGWRNAEKASYSFYGDEVMELVAKYQRQIDVLEQA